MSEIHILRYRGDTVPDVFTIKDADEVVVDITGYTFIMTVDTRRSPIDDTTNLFSIAGVITSGAGGVVSFSPTLGNATQTPGKYYFDIQMTDTGGKIQTLCIGSYTFRQDITKV